MKDSSGSVFSPKKGLEDSLKNKSSSSSTNRSSYSDEKSIEHAKEQLRARSYYATFKILSTISLMMFLPPMLSLFVDLSCMGSSDYCVPHFEMHMDTLKTENDRYILQHIAKGIEIISERADTDTFPLERIEETLTGLANKTGTVYKLNHFGYCRMERGDGSSQENTSDWFEECHTLFDGTDVPSVLLKDVVYEMESSRELDITSPEKDSNQMVSIFRRQLQKSHESSNKLIYYSSMGLSFSMAFVILKITAIVFDTFALFLVFGVALHVKKKTGAVSNSKVKGWLTLATGCLLFSSIVQLLTMIFERAYHEDLYQILTETSFSFIHHFNYFTSGTVIHIIGMSAQVMVIISMFLLISAKPWVVKVVL
ncbi:DEKNAAC105655 [Brettanomyces naardenensis]|uniref:DEKNAAC105655 n=1 Tax=Brettanomyces naardenensis TaxID=13370 RepID=A0A448YTZ1_BRENA|nr:DEKNAAC105655 [Brettanomyces naardenensis]